MKYLSNLLTTALLLLGLALTGCSEQPDREAQLREAIQAMETALENGEISTFMDYISAQYKDPQQRTARDIQQLARLQTLRNRDLYIFHSIGQLSIDGDFAEAVVFVAIAGQPIESADSLLNIRAELLRFQAEFAYDDHWQVTLAEWNRARADNFF